MLKLSRIEMGVVKRTAQSVKMMRKKSERYKRLVEENQRLLDELNAIIDSMEAPVVAMTGGFTSEQVLNGEADAVEAPVSEEDTVAEVSETPEMPVADEETFVDDEQFTI